MRGTFGFETANRVHSICFIMLEFRVFVLFVLIFTSVHSFHPWDNDCDVCSCKFQKTKSIVSCRGEKIVNVSDRFPPNVTDMHIIKAAIDVLKQGSFQNYTSLTAIDIRDVTSLYRIEPGAFDGLINLKILAIYGCVNLKTMERGVLGQFYKLDTLQIVRSGLETVPDFSDFNILGSQNNRAVYQIDLTVNKITTIQSNAFSGVKTNILRVQYSKITSIEKKAFYRAQIIKLFLSHNAHFTTLEEGAFENITDLSTLDLSHTNIRSLPAGGLANVKELFLKNTPSLKAIPSILTFLKLEKAELYYPHHCCAVNNPEKQDPTEWKRFEALQEQVRSKCEQSSSSYMPTYEISTVFPKKHLQKLVRRKRVPNADVIGDSKTLNLYSITSPSFDNNGNGGSTSEFHGFLTETREGDEEISENHFGDIPESKNPLPNVDSDRFGHILPDSGHPRVEDNMGGIFLDNTPITIDKNVNHYVFCGELRRDFRKIECTPKPDAFNPCEDVMGFSWLRIIVWFVLLAAVVGNVLVIVVNITSRHKLTVPKFLMCNLAFSDFLMGVYLLLIASIDARTLGEYFNFAVSWQHEGGCQVAGFLTVFSSELSVYTLTIVTLERWYAISHAIHLTKRLRLKQAIFAMGGGWILASLIAFLPLIGVSGYGRVSICLPMVVNSSVDLIYIVSILVLNGVAFVIIFISYVSMYWKVRSSEVTAGSNDATIAKRMAMLVFTNFACWAPIAFFGLTAAAGAPLIDITDSKILMVFFYPLNSCADPFLYVILTKQFRKDFILLLDRCGMCTERAYTYKAAMDWSKYWARSHNNSSARLHITNDSSYSLTSDRPIRSSLNKTQSDNTTTSILLSDIKSDSRNSSDNSRMLRRICSGVSNNKTNSSRKFQCEHLPQNRTKSCPDRYNGKEVVGRKVRSVSEYVILYPFHSRSGNGNVVTSSSPEIDKHTPERRKNAIASALEDMDSTSLIQTLSLDLSLSTTTGESMFSETSKHSDRAGNSSLHRKNSEYSHKNVMKRTDPVKRNQFHIADDLYTENDRYQLAQSSGLGGGEFFESTDDERSPCLRRK